MALVDYQEDVGKPVGAGRFYFTEAQKARLHQEFRRNNNPSKEWRQELADELEVPAKKIDMWYGATRQKKKIAQEKKAASGYGPLAAAETEIVYSRPAVLPAPVLPPPHVDKISHPAPQPQNSLQLGDEIPIVPLKVSAADNSDDTDANLAKQKALFEKMDAKDIAWNFLNLAKEFTELKNMFDATEEKIKLKMSRDGLSTVVGQDDSREKLLEQSDVWVDNDPSVPKGWSTKQSKNGANKGLRKIFRDRSGKIFYSRKQAVTDMIQKKSYSSEEIRLMESFCKPGDINRQDLEYYKHSEQRNTSNKTIEEHCIENSTEWVENSPDVPKGWKIKEVNGVTMLKVPPPSNEMFLSRISAYKALVDNPVGHEDEIDAFDNYFKCNGINPEIEMRNIEGSEWKTDKYLPPGWKYMHTIREAPHRSSGYKRLLSFLTEKGTKLNSSLVALEYMSDAGFSKNDKDRLRAFVNASKNNEKRKLEYLKANSKMGQIMAQSQLLHQTEEKDDQYLQTEFQDKSWINSEHAHYEAPVYSNDSHVNVMAEVNSVKSDVNTDYFTHDESEFSSSESYWTRFTSFEKNNMYSNVIHEDLKEKEISENQYHDESESLVPGDVSEYATHASKMEEFYPSDVNEQLPSADRNDVQAFGTVSLKQELNRYERLDKDDDEGQNKIIGEKFSEAGMLLNHLQQSSSSNEENKSPSEVDTTLYKTALPETSIGQLGNSDSSLLDQYDTAQWNDESVLMIDEHSRGPNIEEHAHLVEHNYNVPQPRKSKSLLTSNSCLKLPPGPKVEHESPVNESKTTKRSGVDDTSILFKVNETETSCVDEFAKKSNKTEHIPARNVDDSSVILDPKIKSLVSVQIDIDSTEIKDLEGMSEEKDIARYQDSANDSSWFEADDGDLDAIESKIKSENEIMNESIKEEEEINEFIQKEFAMQKEEKQKEALENANKMFKGAVRDLHDRNAELKKFITSDRGVDSNVESVSLIDQDIDNFLINDLLISDEDDGTKADKKDSERSSSEMEGKRFSEMRGDMRYAPDPFLPEGWKQANYFVKRTGMEASRYMSPDGQKFTSRKLMIFFMKTKGYSQEVLDRVMEGTKCKRRAKGPSPPEEASEDPTPEVQRKKIVKERFITNLTDCNYEKEGNKRKRESKGDEKDYSHSYNADVSTNGNDEAFNEGAQKKRKRGRPRKDETLEVKKEPISEPSLGPVNNLLEKPVTDQDESTIGPKITIPRTAYKQLSVLFLKSPIPSNSELASISKTTNVSAKDVKWWFIKIRHKIKVNKVEKEMLNNYLDSIRICHSENGFVSI